MLRPFNTCIRTFVSLPRIFKVGIFGGVLCGILGLAIFGSGRGLLMIFMFILLGLLLIGLLVVFLFRIYSAKQSGKIGSMLVGEVKGEGPSHAAFDQAQKDLSDQWEKAISTLNERDVNLYEMPWYCIMGEPASGKTTLLSKSGIQFLLGTNPLPGGRGTRNCEFLFAKAATILDTAGRFTFPQAGTTDESEWEKFLQLLTRNRAQCPINGVIVTIPCTSLLEEDAEKQHEKARIINTRLKQMQNMLGIVFPVYVLITKCDRILGFTEFFSKLPALKQDQIVGWTTAGVSSETVKREDVLKNLKDLEQRLQGMLFSLLSDKMDPPDRDPMFLFPREFSSVLPMIADYCETIFQQEFHEENLLFRGIYFSSGVQQGKPIASACAQILSDISFSELDLTKELDQVFTKSRSFFISDLFMRKIFPEHGLVSPSKRQRKKVKGIQRTIDTVLYTYGAILLAALILGGLFTLKETGRAKSSLDQFESSVAASEKERKEILKAVPEDLEDYKDKKHAAWTWLNPIYLFGQGKRDALYSSLKDEFVEKADEHVIGEVRNNLWKDMAQKLEKKLRDLSASRGQWGISIEDLTDLFKAYRNVAGLSERGELSKEEIKQLRGDMVNLLDYTKPERGDESMAGTLAHYLMYTRVQVFDAPLDSEFARLWNIYWKGQFANPSGDKWTDAHFEEYRSMMGCNGTGVSLKDTCRKIIDLLDTTTHVTDRWIENEWNPLYKEFAGHLDPFNDLFKEGGLSLAARRSGEGKKYELEISTEIRKEMERSYRELCSFFPDEKIPADVLIDLDVNDEGGLIDLNARKHIIPDNIEGIIEIAKPDTEESLWKITPTETCSFFTAMIENADDFMQPRKTGSNPFEKIFPDVDGEKLKLDDLLALEDPVDIGPIMKEIEEHHEELKQKLAKFVKSIEKSGPGSGAGDATWLGRKIDEYDDFLEEARNNNLDRALGYFFDFLDEPPAKYFNSIGRVYYSRENLAEIKESNCLEDLYKRGKRIFRLEENDTVLSRDNIDLITNLLDQLDGFTRGKNKRLKSFEDSFYKSYARQFEDICNYYLSFSMGEDDGLEVFCKKNSQDIFYRKLDMVLSILKTLSKAYYKGEEAAEENENDALRLFKEHKYEDIVGEAEGLKVLPGILTSMMEMGEEKLKKLTAKGEAGEGDNPLEKIQALARLWGEMDPPGSGEYLSRKLELLHGHAFARYGEFDAEEAIASFERLKRDILSKFAPFNAASGEDIDDDELKRVQEDIELISYQLEKGPEKDEAEAWKEFIRPFLEGDYRITMKFDAETKDNKWREFNGYYGFNVAGVEMEGFKDYNFLDMDSGEYTFEWNPLESDEEEFVISIFEKQKRAKGWYLNKKNPNNMMINTPNKEANAFKGKWGFLKYINSVMDSRAVKGEVESMRADHEFRYRIRESDPDQDIEVSIFFTFDPPFKSPPKEWWKQE